MASVTNSSSGSTGGSGGKISAASTALGSVFSVVPSTSTAGERAATATSASTAVDVANRAAAAAFSAENEAGREAGKRGGPAAAPAATPVAIPVHAAAVAPAGPTTIPADRAHQQSAPPAPAAVATKAGEKRRRVSAVECLRGFNRRGVAEDGPGEERRSVKRTPGAAEEGASRGGRASKRARQPKGPLMG